MSDIASSDSKPAAPDAPPNAAGAARRSPITWVEIALACGWLLVPAAQYYGTLQRTGLQVGGTASSPGLAVLDLTLLYAILFAATVILVLFRPKMEVLAVETSP